MIWVLIKKELLSIYKSKSLFWGATSTTIAMVLALSGIFMLATYKPDTFQSPENQELYDEKANEIITKQFFEQNPKLQGRDLNPIDIVQVTLGLMITNMLFVLPTSSVVMMGSLALINERKGDTLEPLIATPISTIEILFSKSLAYTIFAAYLIWSSALFIAIMFYNTIQEPALLGIIISPQWLLQASIFTPLVIHGLVIASFIISSYLRDPRSAQQWVSWLILPIGYAAFTHFIFVKDMYSDVSLAHITIAILIATIVNIIGTIWAIKAFNRENILVGKH